MKRKLALVIGVIVVFTIAGIMLCSAYRSSESYRKKKAAETIFENIMAGNYFTFADKYLSAYPKNSNSK